MHGQGLLGPREPLAVTEQAEVEVEAFLKVADWVERCRCSGGVMVGDGSS